MWWWHQTLCGQRHASSNQHKHNQCRQLLDPVYTQLGSSHHWQLTNNDEEDDEKHNELQAMRSAATPADKLQHKRLYVLQFDNDDHDAESDELQAMSSAATPADKLQLKRLCVLQFDIVMLDVAAPDPQGDPGSLHSLLSHFLSPDSIQQGLQQRLR